MALIVDSLSEEKGLLEQFVITVFVYREADCSPPSLFILFKSLSNPDDSYQAPIVICKQAMAARVFNHWLVTIG